MLHSTTKLVLAGLLAGSLSACGGGGSVESLQTKLDSIIVDNHIDLSAFDTNGDAYLSGQELIDIWNTLDSESKQLIATEFNATVDELNNIVNNIPETIKAATESIYNLNTAINIDAAHATGYTGEGQSIAIIDSFYGANGWHGNKVSTTVSLIAPDAAITEAHRGFTFNDAVNVIGRTQGHDVVNISWGKIGPGSGAAANLAAELEEVTDKDSLYVIAAGNEFGPGDKSCSTTKSCNYVAVAFKYSEAVSITVGALDDSGTKLAEYSVKAGFIKDNYITTTTFGETGTSIAAPIVSGTAALIMDKYNTDAAATRSIIFDTADDLGAPGVDAVFGHGRLNVGAALSPVGDLN